MKKKSNAIMMAGVAGLDKKLFNGENLSGFQLVEDSRVEIKWGLIDSIKKIFNKNYEFRDRLKDKINKKASELNADYAVVKQTFSRDKYHMAKNSILPKTRDYFLISDVAFYKDLKEAQK